MTLSLAQMTNGLTPEHDLVFAQCPDNPEMRESTSVWLYEENGKFAFPRTGIEAVGDSWDSRHIQVNIAFPGGRVLNGGVTGAPAHSPFDSEGHPTILGAGPLAYQCIKPFFKWRMTYDGSARDGTSTDQIKGTYPKTPTMPVKFDVELDMVTPAWVHDYSPEKVAKMSRAEAISAGNMGLGWRYEHLFRATGTFEVDGVVQEFKGTGVHVKRQSVRPMAGFHGHFWQSAVFPDGRAFGLNTYPPDENGFAFNDAYIFQDGKMHRAKVVGDVPWLRRLIGEGEDVSVQLESELGITKIAAVSAFSTFRPNNPGVNGLNLSQAGALFTWDGQSAYGMMERSFHGDLTGG